jgi:hypothetical protein
MRADGNQAEIVAALKRIGASVHDTHRVGDGFPDLVVGYRGATGLLELKLPGRDLEPHQGDWHAAWRGAPVLVARTVEEAIAELTYATKASLRRSA